VKRWQCAGLCFAVGPVITVSAAWLLSGPILELYEAGRMGTDPTWPLIHIVCGSLTIGAVLSIIMWIALQQTLPANERAHLHIWRR